ncbi:MAG TPA: wax ester/triacylglycerol synthase family O-acyltransferase [Candidatus Binataceae bacterium]
MAPNSLGTSRSYRLSTQDATFIYAETINGPLHIGSIGFLEGRIEFDRLVRHLEDRIYLIPRYRQRLVPVPLNLAHAMMEDDPNFRVADHFHLHELTAGISEADALAEIMSDYERPLDRSRPLWEGHVYEGLEGGRSAVMWKVHHCLVDGVSGVELLKATYDFHRESPPVPPEPEPWAPAALSNPLKRFADAARDVMSNTVDSAARATREMREGAASTADRARALGVAARQVGELVSRKIVAAPWNAAPISQRRSLAWLKLSFTDFRTIRSTFGGSVNDVVLTVLTEGAARYLKHHGYAANGAELCVACPVNVRRKEEQSALGNRVSMMFPTAPAEPIDVVERLKQINEQTERIKSSGSAQALDGMLGLSDGIPPSLMAAASRVATFTLDAASAVARLTGWTPRPGGFALPAPGLNFIATNVPGVMVPLYLTGDLLLDMIPLVPLAANVGYSVAILSYNQSLYFGMVAEPRLMPDVALMKSFVEEAFTELKRRCDDAATVAPGAPAIKAEAEARAAD